MEIKTRNRAELKSYFVKNSIPTESNFAELIDGMLSQKDDGLVKLPGNPLSIEAAGDDASEKKALNIYQSFGDPNPAWTVSLNPRSTPNDPGTAKLGFNISDGEGNSRLFIDRSSGNVGISARPGEYRLRVEGSALFTGNYLYVNSENAGRLRVGAAWGMPGLYSGDDGAKSLMLAVPSGQKVYLGVSNQDAYVEGGTGHAWFKGNLKINGAITPSAGNTTGSGIMFPTDPFGGSGDAAWIRYHNARGGEKGTLEIGVGNDGDDHIILMPSGNVGIGTTAPTEKLDVNGRVRSGALTVGSWPASEEYVFFGTNALDQKAVGNYALLIDTSGDDRGRTFLNSPVDIRFRIGNDDKMILANNGNMGIGTMGPVAKLDIQQAGRSGSHPTAVKGLYVTGDFAADSDGVEFRHSNATQGIGFGYNTIYATGSNADQDLGLKARGNGKVKVTGALQVSGAITPSAGNTTSSGIMFPTDPFGGGGDTAWIRYHNARGGERGTLEISIGNDSDDHIILMSSGNVGIGTTDPQAKLDVRGSIHAGESDIYFTNTEHNHTGFGNAIGYAAIENAKNHDALMILGRQNASGKQRRVKVWDYLEVVGTFVNNSDQRAKKDIEDLKYGLEEIRNLRPVSFNWKTIFNQHKSLGLIAQEVKSVIREAVYTDDPDTVNSGLGIAYVSLIPVLINAIKELDAKLELVISENTMR